MLEFIKEREDCKLEAYLDIAGIPTIGWGSLFIYSIFPHEINQITGRKRKVKLGDKITQEHADYLFDEEAFGILRKIDALVIPPLNNNQMEALASFCYNCGVPAFKNSTLRKVINETLAQGKGLRRETIQKEWMRWNKAHIDGKLVQVKGLTNRRKLEWDLWCKSV